MFFTILWDVTVALFAVFGFYCAVKAFAELLFASSRICVAIEVRSLEDAEMLEELLCEARSCYLRKSRARPLVLISTELMEGSVGEGEELFEEYTELLSRHGADCYLIDP